MNLDFDDVVLNGFTLKKIGFAPLKVTTYDISRSHFLHTTNQQTIYCNVLNIKYMKETEGADHKSLPRCTTSLVFISDTLTQ